MIDRSFVLEWNVDYPIDKWWRDKYNIPFGSAQHRSMSHLDMLFVYIEYFLYKGFEKKLFDTPEEETPDYVPGKKNFLKQKIKSQMSDKQFEDLDLDKFIF